MHYASTPKVYKGCLFTLITALLAFFLLVGIASWNLGRFLDVTQPVERADAIVVMGGEGGQYLRTQQALSLYDSGVAPIVIFSGGTLLGSGLDCTSTQMSVDAATQLGLPKDAIVLSGQAQSTRDEAGNVVALAADNDWHSIVLVTDVFHTRRSIATMRSTEPDIVWLASAPDDPRYNVARWWTHEDGLVFAMNETLKLAFYWKNYGISPFYRSNIGNE